MVGSACQNCDYDLTGLLTDPGAIVQCPECGQLQKALATNPTWRWQYQARFAIPPSVVPLAFCLIWFAFASDGWEQMGIALVFMPIAVVLGGMIGGAVAVWMRRPRLPSKRDTVLEWGWASLLVGLADAGAAVVLTALAAWAFGQGGC